MGTVDYKECAEFALELANKVKSTFQSINLSFKTFVTKSGPRDFVTESDKLIERQLFELIKNKYPDHSFIGEESVENDHIKLGDEPTWIIDPIDGTTNFIHLFPFYCVSIGMVHNKKPAVGVIYCPSYDLLYWAYKGGGAYLNGNPIHVSGIKNISESLILTNYGSSTSEKIVSSKCMLVKDLIHIYNVHAVRTIGSSAMSLCIVASGGAECFYEHGNKCWDVAAGMCIIQEAGGSVASIGMNHLDFLNEQFIGCSSIELMSQMQEAIKKLYVAPE